MTTPNDPIEDPPALPGRLSEYDFCGSLPGLMGL